MALKADRNILETDISFTCESAAEEGTFIVALTSGSGASLGDTAGKGDLVANPSGYAVAGCLLSDVVSIDETRYHRNFHKAEQKTGERVNLLTKGWVTTNKVVGTPKFGDVAYLTTSGSVTPTVSATGGVAATPKVGRFGGSKDEDGYVRVDVNLPA